MTRHAYPETSEESARRAARREYEDWRAAWEKSGTRRFVLDGLEDFGYHQIPSGTATEILAALLGHEVLKRAHERRRLDLSPRFWQNYQALLSFDLSRCHPGLRSLLDLGNQANGAMEISMAGKGKGKVKEAPSRNGSARGALQERMVEIFRMKRVPPDEEITRRIKEEFPWSAFSQKTHVPWYRAKFLKGELRGQDGPEAIAGFVPRAHRPKAPGHVVGPKKLGSTRAAKAKHERSVGKAVKALGRTRKPRAARAADAAAAATATETAGAAGGFA